MLESNVAIMRTVCDSYVRRMVPPRLTQLCLPCAQSNETRFFVVGSAEV